MKRPDYSGDDNDRLAIERIFTYHTPIAELEQPQRYIELRELARQLALSITRNCPASREKSLAITNLQQATMWANAAIAINEDLR